MSDFNAPKHQQPGDKAPSMPPAPIEPASDASPKSAADEMFAHGLLTYLHTDTPTRQDQRVRRVMSSLRAGHDRAAGSSSFRFPIRTGRGWLALAACLTLGTVAVFLGVPGEQSAQAVVQQSIDAMRSTTGGDRRYEIRLTRRAEETLPSLPGAIIDTRSPNLLLLRANAPDGHEIIAGRDSTGDWAIRMDGGIERTHPEVAWPRWAKVGDESLFVDSVDRLLEELTKSYDLQKEGTATIDGKGSASYRHIVGTKKRHPSPGGDHVEVWIDAATKSVERLEMRWELPKPRDGEGPGGPSGPGGPGAGPADGPDQPDGPGPQGRGDDRPNRGPMNGPPRDPMRRRPPRADGPDAGPRGPGPDGPGPDGPRPEGRPEGRGPNGPDDLNPDDADRPLPGAGGPGGPGGPENRRPMRGPEGRPMDGPRDGRAPDDRGPRDNRGGPGPRGPGPGLRPLPPKLLVMQRVEVPALENTWFSPETHVAK